MVRQARPSRVLRLQAERERRGCLLRQRGRGLPNRRPLWARHRLREAGGRRRPLLRLRGPDSTPQSCNSRRAPQGSIRRRGGAPLSVLWRGGRVGQALLDSGPRTRCEGRRFADRRPLSRAPGINAGGRRMVASLVEELEAAGELENTYVFFTSDNGYHLGEHRLRQGKKTPYEEAARVPLLVRGPGVPAGSTVEDLVLNADIAPTFAELAGLEEFAADGRSLLPLIGLIRGEGSPSWRSSVLLEAFLDGRNAGEESNEGGDDEESVGKNGDEGSRMDRTAFGAVRTKTYKYIEHETGEKELYDLETDPYELENVYETADPSLIEDLKARLEALRDCEGEGCQEAEDAP